MPTYVYACKSGDHRFEAVQSFTDEPLTECPECGGAARRHYGSIGVTFNGSGFYRTDSRAASGKSEGGSETKTETKTPKKSESKTSAKSEKKSSPASPTS